jgi:TonB family protein
MTNPEDEASPSNELVGVGMTAIPGRTWRNIAFGSALFLAGLVLGGFVVAAGIARMFNATCPAIYPSKPGEIIEPAVGPGFFPPRVIERPARFPTAARIARVQGRVVMLARIESDGRVSQAHILVSSGFCPFDAEAQRALPSWRYAPAMRLGTPIATWWIVNVDFRRGPQIGGRHFQPLGGKPNVRGRDI